MSADARPRLRRIVNAKQVGVTSCSVHASGWSPPEVPVWTTSRFIDLLFAIVRGDREDKTGYSTHSGGRVATDHSLAGGGV